MSKFQLWLTNICRPNGRWKSSALSNGLTHWQRQEFVCMSLTASDDSPRFSSWLILTEPWTFTSQMKMCRNRSCTTRFQIIQFFSSFFSTWCKQEFSTPRCERYVLNLFYWILSFCVCLCVLVYWSSRRSQKDLWVSDKSYKAKGQNFQQPGI